MQHMLRGNGGGRGNVQQLNLGRLLQTLLKHHALSFLLSNTVQKSDKQGQQQRLVAVMSCDHWHEAMLKDDTPYKLCAYDMQTLIRELGDTLQCRRICETLLLYSPGKEVLLLAVDTASKPKQYVFQRIRSTS